MARIITELSDLRPGRRFCFEGTLFEVVGYSEQLEAWELCEPEERGRLLVYRDGQVFSTPLRGGEYQDPEPTFLAVDALEAVVDRTDRRETGTMATNKTRVGADAAEARRLADHEARLRRLEAWVARTEVETEDGVSYPCADILTPWADPKDAARLFSPEGQEELRRLVYGDDPFVGLPEEAVPFAAAALMRERQEAYLAGDEDRPVDQGYNLVVGLNNTATNDPCAICGNRTDPEVGPELFLQGTEALVCYDCGRKHAPALAALLDLLALKRHLDERRYIGRTQVVFDDVDQGYNMAAEGLVALKKAIVAHIEAGCQVPVAARLFKALGKADEAFKALKEAFDVLYSQDGRVRRDTPDEEIPF